MCEQPCKHYSPWIVSLLEPPDTKIREDGQVPSQLKLAAIFADSMQKGHPKVYFISVYSYVYNLLS